MANYWVDLNSFMVEADSEDEAYKKGAEMIKKDPTLALPLSIVEEPEDE